jgi:lipase chaperone LimK
MSRKPFIWLAGGVAVVAVAAIVLLLPIRHADVPRPSTPTTAVSSEPVPPANANDSRERPEQVAASPALPASAAAPSEPVTAQRNEETFRVNDAGRLVLDEQTRLNMEALFARTERDRLAEAKQQAVEPLPAGAEAQAAELLEQYDNYQQAQRQAYPPGIAPATEEAALAELDGLHALRAAHFGPIVARALYGQEEATSRELIELMRLEKDQSLTMEEKAVRAQQLRDAMSRDSR